MTASLVRALCALLAPCAASLAAQQPPERPASCAKLPRPANAALPRVSVPSKWFDVYRVDPAPCATPSARLRRAAAGTRDSALVTYAFDGFSIQLPVRRAPASKRDR